MNSLLEKLRACDMHLEHADYLQLPEYQALRKEEDALYKKLVSTMGEHFAEEYGNTANAVCSFVCSSWFQKGMRLGAQLMLAMLEPLE